MSTRTPFSAGRTDLPGQASGFEARRDELRQTFENSRDPMIAAQRADLAKTEAERRASQMVKQDRPKPVQRPSPALAHGPDGSSFNARWRAERRDAANDAATEARKAAFKAKRQAQSPSRARSHEFNRGDQHDR